MAKRICKALWSVRSEYVPKPTTVVYIPPFTIKNPNKPRIIMRTFHSINIAVPTRLLPLGVYMMSDQEVL